MEVLFEDNHIIAVNKLAGELVQGDKTGDEILPDKVKAYLKKKYNKPGNVFLGVTHRLDRPTSGVVLFARTSKALSRLNQMFKQHQYNKIYWALVEGKVAEAKGLKHYLKKNEKQNKSYVSNANESGAKLATLHFKPVQFLDHYTLLEVELETGRHHQIRCQLASTGSPIKGDLKYGAKRSNKDGSISLHARSISFEHPVTKEEIKIVAPPPKDPLWDACLG
ncbi:MAG: RluA family pseudouridine synthase [Luteibaculum sp.]